MVAAPPRDGAEANGVSKERVLRTKIGLLNAQYLAPSIMALHGMPEARPFVHHGEISLTQFPAKKYDRYKVWAVFEFLASLGYVRIDGELVTATPLGKAITRDPSFLGTPLSYIGYCDFLPILRGERPLSTDRRLNVHGSGGVHGPFITSRLVHEALKSGAFQAAVDVGCGNGRFLSFLHKTWKDLTLIGTDFDSVSLRESAGTLGGRATDDPRFFAMENGCLFGGDIKAPEKLRDSLVNLGVDPRRTMLFTFFIFHEVLGHSDVHLVDLLNRYHALFGRQLVFAEIFDIPWHVIARSPDMTPAAVYLLFHRLADQKPISFAQWEAAIQESHWAAHDFVPVGRPVGETDPPCYWSGVFGLKG